MINLSWVAARFAYSGGSTGRLADSMKQRAFSRGCADQGLWQGGIRAAAIPFFVSLVLTFASAGSLPAAENLLTNGDFSHGRGRLADGWHTEQWDKQPGTTQFLYRPPASQQPGMVGIISHRPNDARWVQEVRVREQAWYHLTGKVRTQGVGSKAMGATLSFSSGDTYRNSNDLRGSKADWQPLELWTKTAKWQTRLKVALRLGGYGSTNAGEAWFSEVRLEQVGQPPPGSPNVFDAPVRRAGKGPWSLWALIVVLGLITAALWRYLGSGPPDGASQREKLVLVGGLLLLLVLKLVLAPHFGYANDLGTYKAWAYDLAARGPENFYRPGYFADYPPAYIYLLWLVGSALREAGVAMADQLATTAIKLPALLADLFAAWVLFALLRARVGLKGTWAVVLAYALNPALIFNSTIWGQTDSVFTLVIFLGIGLIINGSLGFGWALMALAALTKPQALVFLPLMAMWPGNWKAPEKLVGAALAGAVVAVSLIFPVGGSQPLQWIINLYSKGAGYYGETSVNAFNVMAIMGGLRRNDLETWMGFAFRSWGTVFLLAYFAFALYLLWRRHDRKMMLYLCFLTPLALFLLMTRMHERYLYPCFLFLAPLLPGRRRLWAIFCVLTVTYLVNLWYVLAALNANRFLALHDPVAMACAGVNSLVFVAAIMEGCWLAREPGVCDGEETAGDLVLPAVLAGPRLPAAVPSDTRIGVRKAGWDFEVGSRKFRLTRLDIILALLLTVAAGGVRCFNLSEPAELVFDEVYFVEQARNYLRGQEFMDPHPPLAKLAIAGSILSFGNKPAGWRGANALTGSLLVGIAYLLGRKMFGSRVGALMAAGMVMLDGLFIVDSRTAVIDIYYVTFGAVAYLLLFSFLRSSRRPPALLIGVGVFVGLALASKLFIPAFTWLVVVLTLLAVSGKALFSRRYFFRALAPAALVTASGGAVYLAAYLPHYYLGWWHGIGDIAKYFKDVVGYQQAVAEASHPYASKWWSWPFLLRPVWYYFKDVPGDASRIIGVWAGGNPVVWWGGVVAVVLVAINAFRRRQVAAAFITAGFILHWAPWIPIGRVLFQYHYLPSLFFATLALGMVMGDLWEGKAANPLADANSMMLLPLLPALSFWLGMAGVIAFGVGVLAFTQAGRLGLPATKALVLVYAAVGLGLAVYFYPLWVGLPITKSDYSARMWFQGSKLPNWI